MISGIRVHTVEPGSPKFNDGIGSRRFPARNIVQEIVPPKYENVAVLTEELIAISENQIWHFVNSSGKPVNEFGYTEISYLNDDLGKVVRNGKTGFIDPAGKESIPCKFDEAESFSEGKARVKLNGQEFYIDTKGNLIN